MKLKKIIFITLFLFAILTISGVSAMEDSTSEYQQNNVENTDTLSLDEQQPTDLQTFEDDSIISSNEESQLSLSHDDENTLSSTNDEVLGSSNAHSYKITVKPSTVYAHTKGKYQAKVTDNGVPLVGVWGEISIIDKYGEDWGNMVPTNNKGILTVEISDTFPKGDYKVTVTVFDEYDDVLCEEHSTIKSVPKPENKIKVKAPSKISAKYKSGKLFKIKVKNYKGKPFKKFKLYILIWKGKYNWKKVKDDFVIKTNNKGIAKFNTNRLSPGKYNVGIVDDNGKYDYHKKCKVIIKKTAKKSNSKYKIITTKAKTYWVSKKSGSFKVKTKIWDMTAGYMAPYKYIDTTLYKNGKQVYNTKYSVKYKINGKWTGWSKYGTTSTAHHRHAVSDGSTVDKIKVKVKKNVNSFM